MDEGNIIGWVEVVVAALGFFFSTLILPAGVWIFKKVEKQGEHILKLEKELALNTQHDQETHSFIQEVKQDLSEIKEELRQIVLALAENKIRVKP